ncbi:DUF3168 domain-containing protein [Devosia rhodophyticola]|uniref:DUF3168 domain-containing protein n=1 Tax=Devosia rhodophyticola TaxID=3026423 RepID=A0ABY7YWL0_9HYPH|nr:DUF3168 domain-containing protein [Devosia rhodophyticola]WDR05626.1 DUF3168 domain-containing protein [Devosia rhodophyticola]
MTEPSLAFQIAIRNHLVTASSVTDLVAPDWIIDGPTRPEHFPCIIVGESQTLMVGRSYRTRSIEIFSDVHIWSAQEGGLAVVKEIGGVVWNALESLGEIPGFSMPDGIRIGSLRTMRDPKGHGHAVINVQAMLEELHYA